MRLSRELDAVTFRVARASLVLPEALEDARRATYGGRDVFKPAVDCVHIPAEKPRFV